MSGRALRIGVVGLGPAGQASAIFLTRAGHRVTALEQAATPGPLGAGLLLQPTGLAALDELGLCEAAISLGERIERLHAETAAGRTVLSLRYADLEPGLFGLGIHRGALFALLHRVVCESGVEIRTGVRVERAEEEANGVFAVDQSGERHGPFDLLIGADGAASKLRVSVLGGRPATTFRYGALWFVANDDDRAFAGTLAQVCDGTRRMIGFLPTGRDADSATGRGTVSVFWSVALGAIPGIRKAGLGAWKDDVRRLTRLADVLLDQVDNFDRVIGAAYHLPRLKRWHRRRVVFIGDAAHAMSPQLGQGVNLALMDASALAAAIGRHERIEPALEEFERVRRPHVRFYQRASTALTPFFQSDRAWLGPVRDLLLGPACRVGPIRRQMLLSLAGVKTGALSAMALRRAPGVRASVSPPADPSPAT